MPDPEKLAVVKEVSGLPRVPASVGAGPVLWQDESASARRMTTIMKAIRAYPFFNNMAIVSSSFFAGLWSA
jgi:hypothetical protein